MRNKMIIGIDFDNTIVCYDGVFYWVALEQGFIPPHIPKNKISVRDYLRKQGRENLWTELQGIVYGARMSYGKTYPGAIGFLEKLILNNIPFYIISHRTRYPFLGEKHDLHKAAKEWLKGLDASSELANKLQGESVFFLETKEQKAGHIEKMGCTHFIDDLPEFLEEAYFPCDTYPMLFDPYANHKNTKLHSFPSWQQIEEYFLT